jgi:hypothetical protein
MGRLRRRRLRWSKPCSVERIEGHLQRRRRRLARERGQFQLQLAVRRGRLRRQREHLVEGLGRFRRFLVGGVALLGAFGLLERLHQQAHRPPAFCPRAGSSGSR